MTVQERQERMDKILELAHGDMVVVNAVVTMDDFDCAVAIPSEAGKPLLKPYEGHEVLAIHHCHFKNHTDKDFAMLRGTYVPMTSYRIEGFKE